MGTTELNASEKASLSQLARRLVERGTRASAEAADPPREAGGETDTFSKDGQLLRLLEIEKRIEAIGRDWSKTLDAVLATVERLETRVSRLDGEVEGLHDREQGLERSVKRHGDELTASAGIFAESAAARIEEALARIDAMLSARAPDDASGQLEATTRRG